MRADARMWCLLVTTTTLVVFSLMEADDADAPDRCWVVVEEASVAAVSY
jgi:hypothetical protein